MEVRPKKPISSEILSHVPRKDSYDKSHGSGNPHLQPGELQEAFRSLRVLHYQESVASAATAELVAEKPATSS